MTLGSLDLAGLLYVARRMRRRDREEIFATRLSDSADDLALEIFQMRHLGVAFLGYASDGEPVAAYGLYRVWGDTYSMWMFATDRWPEVRLAMTRFAVRTIIPEMFASGMRSAHCLSLAGYDGIHKWLRMLGAVEDCVLTEWGKNGEDFVRFVLKNPNRD